MDPALSASVTSLTATSDGAAASTAPNLDVTQSLSHGSSQTDRGSSTARPGKIGRFQIVDELGSGGFGSVFLAHDPVVQRPIALKIARHDRPGLSLHSAQILGEARAAARVQHPNIVTVFDAGQDPVHGVWIAMEYVKGKSLAELLRRQGPLPLAEVLRIMIGVAEGLHWAHKQRLYHRDLKPANILVGDENESVKVVDFGLAIDEAAQSTAGGEWAGTLAYMSPEQVRMEADKLDGRSDVWSIGVVLFELLAGRKPFLAKSQGPGDLADLRQAILSEEPRPPLEQLNDRLPPQLVALCRRCLEKDPALRPQSALLVARELKQIAAALKPPVPRRRWLALAGGGAAVAALGLGGGAWLLSSGPRTGPGGWTSALALEPQFVVWDAQNVENRCARILGSEALELSSAGFGLVSLGEHDERELELTLEASVAEPEGVYGIFWSLAQDRQGNPGQQACRSLVLYLNGPREAVYADGVDLRVLNATTARSKGHGRQPIAYIAGDPLQLHLRILADGTLRVTIGQQEYTITSWQGAGAKGLVPGRFGLVTFSGHWTIHDLRIRHLEKAP
jgi:hypothetical protein